MFLIKIQSKSLGDNIASMHVIEKFRKSKTPNERIGVIAHNTEHYIKSYPMFDFYPLDKEPIKSKSTGEWIISNSSYEYFQRIFFKLHEGLIEGVARQLGISDSDSVSTFPLIDYRSPKIKKEKIITFSMHSTSQLKHWNFENGWEILIDKLKNIGYKVINVDYHESFGAQGYFNPIPNNCIKRNGLELKNVSELIKKSEFFIGISSGLSWLAHSLETPVVMISGMSKPECEFKKSILRIGAQSACRNCFTERNNKFDPKDWLCCPEFKGTDRAFECSKSINPQHVFESIILWIESDKKETFI